MYASRLLAICSRSDFLRASLALILADLKLPTPIVVNIPIIAMTISNSTKVKPLFSSFFELTGFIYFEF